MLRYSASIASIPLPLGTCAACPSAVHSPNSPPTCATRYLTEPRSTRTRMASSFFPEAPAVSPDFTQGPQPAPWLSAWYSSFAR